VLRFEQDYNPRSPVSGSQRVSEAPTGVFFNSCSCLCQTRPGHEDSHLAIAVVQTRRQSGALFRPVPHAPAGHHRIMKSGPSGGRLRPDGRHRRPARTWCREPGDQCGPGHPKAPPTVAPCGEARTADAASVGAPRRPSRSIFKAVSAVMGTGFKSRWLVGETPAPIS
jgi:hypothetical protein